MFFITTSDNVKIAVYDYNPDQNKTVLLIHGWPLSAKIYEYQTERLTSAGYHVVTIDLRGFGNSDTPVYGYSYDRMAADIYQVVCTLDLQDFALAGFSMGGAVALRYMNRYKGCGVRKLFLLAAAAPSWTMRPGYPYGLTVEYVNSLLQQAATDRARLAYDFSHQQLFASPQSEAIKNWFESIAMSASGIGTIQAGISLRDEDGRGDLRTVKVPTVIIHGAKDAVVSDELVNIQHKEITDSRLYTLENSAHGIMYDELEKFNQIFLGEIEEAWK